MVVVVVVVVVNGGVVVAVHRYNVEFGHALLDKPFQVVCGGEL